MLLPALGKARERARSISCLSNMKQLGSIEMFYAQENDDFLCPARNYSTVNKPYGEWYFHMATACSSFVMDGSHFNLKDTPLSKLHCPLVSSHNPRSGGYGIVQTYAPNIAVKDAEYDLGFGPHGGWGINQLAPRKIGAVTNPSSCISFLECSHDYASYDLVYESETSGHFSKPYFIANFHSNGNNILYCDGHAAPYVFKEAKLTQSEAIAQGIWLCK